MKKQTSLQPTDLDTQEPTDDTFHIDNGDSIDNGEAGETMPIPFGALGISFICNVTQYAVYFGLTVLIIMILQILGPK